MITRDESFAHNVATRAEPTDQSLREQYRRLEKAFLEGIERDRADVNRCLERERKFSVEYFRLSTNRIWAKKVGDPVAVYDATVEQYKEGRAIWPYGRELDGLSVYKQIWDFFRFMWGHTKPYKTVAMILLMSLARPFQTAILGYIAQEIEKNPKGVPLWLYFMPFFGAAFSQFMYWWYEMWVPLNSQRVQLRCVLLAQRAQLPDFHPLAYKWTSGRFNGLLKDVDDIVNGIWKSCLSMFDDIVTMCYLLILCFLNLAISFQNKPDENVKYAVYVGVFIALGLFTMGLPFLWFYLFRDKVQECESMVRDGQALYMSVSSDAVAVGSEGLLFTSDGLADIETGDIESPVGNTDRGGERTARKAFRVYGLTTFRSFFHRLAWTTNYSLLSKLWAPLVAYGLLTAEGFGDSFNLTSTLIVLLSLKDLSVLSTKLLDYLVTMSRGCSVLVDVAELLNTDIDAASKVLNGGNNENEEEAEEEIQIVTKEEKTEKTKQAEGSHRVN